MDPWIKSLVTCGSPVGRLWVTCGSPVGHLCRFPLLCYERLPEQGQTGHLGEGLRQVVIFVVIWYLKFIKNCASWDDDDHTKPNYLLKLQDIQMLYEVSGFGYGPIWPDSGYCPSASQTTPPARWKMAIPLWEIRNFSGICGRRAQTFLQQPKSHHIPVSNVYMMCLDASIFHLGLDLRMSSWHVTRDHASFWHMFSRFAYVLFGTDSCVLFWRSSLESCDPGVCWRSARLHQGHHTVPCHLAIEVDC